MRNDILIQVERIKAMGIKPNYSALANQFSCDPRTVKNYMNGSTKQERRKRNIKSLLEDYKTVIIDKVDNCSATAMSIFRFIQKKGYKGQYGLVKKFVREHKKEQIKKSTIRFETNPGLQAQVDFKERKKLKNKNGEIIEFNIFLYLLGYSRVKYMELTKDKSQKTVFNCLMNAFHFTNGIPQEILFDNMATVVDRHNTFIGEVQYNKRFSQFAKDFNFKPIACKPYRAQTKGKVEAFAKLTNRLDVYNYEFVDIEDLTKIVNEVNNELNTEVSQAINCTPSSRFNEEKKYLLELPNKDIFYSYNEKNKKYKVSKESMITYLGHKYSVATSYIGKLVDVEVVGNELKVSFNDDVIAIHKISEKLLNYKKEHAIEILKSDAFKNSSDKQIEQVLDNMQQMDMLLG